MSLTTSKDLAQISRLAAILHVFINCMECILAGRIMEISSFITEGTLKTAHQLYLNALKQKSLFLEVNVKYQNHINQNIEIRLPHNTIAS